MLAPRGLGVSFDMSNVYVVGGGQRDIITEATMKHEYDRRPTSSGNTIVNQQAVTSQTCIRSKSVM